MDHASGLKAPIICHRHGISERTLLRWLRERPAPAGGGPEPIVPGGEHQGAVCREALCVVLGMMSVPERRRALRLVESRLHLTRGRGPEVLLGCDPRDLRHVPSGAHVVGVPVSRPCLDFAVAETLAAARWLVVRGPLGRFAFVQASAESMLSALRECGCTDVICASLEDAVAAEWISAGIRLWRAAPNATLRHQIALLESHVLRRWRPPRLSAR